MTTAENSLGMLDCILGSDTGSDTEIDTEIDTTEEIVFEEVEVSSEIEE